MLIIITTTTTTIIIIIIIIKLPTQSFIVPPDRFTWVVLCVCLLIYFSLANTVVRVICRIAYALFCLFSFVSGDIGDTSDRRRRPHMGFSERIETILNWTELVLCLFIPFYFSQQRGLFSAQRIVTWTQQRHEPPTVHLVRHTSKNKVHKLHEGHSYSRKYVIPATRVILDNSLVIR